MVHPEVLVVGAGPVGLTAAIELRRRGVACRIIDPLLEPPQYAKAVGIQPRTLEVFESMGVLRNILDASIEMLGQIVYVNGDEVARLELSLPADVPFEFLGLPQYETERILTEYLATFGTTIERGTRLTEFEQDDDGVVATVTGADGDETVRTQYLLGCDGAHSVVRKGLGLTFEGGAFTEQYMLGDVEVDWSVPRGWGIRSMHQTDGETDDLLVCIPLPGHRRYRMSMLVPDDLAGTGTPAGDKIAHGFEAGPKPELRHIQAVIDRLSPQPTRASNLRWSSVFRISHRIVDSYGRGRVFVAGDAAHIHPPTGAQGMNTGIQDAHNLAWKVALAVSGAAAPDLLDSYDAERRPVGEEVVGRTVRSAREGIGAGSSDPDHVIRREAQLLISYADSPIVADWEPTATLAPGGRAPDARGLTRAAVAFPIRLFTLLGGRNHTLLLYADNSVDARGLELLEAAATSVDVATGGRVDTYLVASPAAEVGETVLPLVRDRDGEFARAYGAEGTAAFVVRPDGYLGFRQNPVAMDGLTEYLKSTFR
ncbi:MULTISPECIES: FAD-dependent monooxygenase [unclassified Rhodococcus (in: high G+C Gram-positive bacteria)]|uniref:FAD-dependent monooxygenase n=1 Tax=unclassified Rhodococcus (in: high G+C Gram-positive bacteria) TaxID=192944 RepID=UPI00163A00D2|nr:MULTISPECIES: FAD-dependent monooxygenase [unclassified Rhodococcus (in: high G+C Gram-positive bacteria)]MBC2639800.1 FAD-dependent monooxygenase [Rhodococcus sp. 3A]MBC2895455.1 FAD-dependent monooxygenase [Rhodococcus sp. 4CII]